MRTKKENKKNLRTNLLYWIDESARAGNKERFQECQEHIRKIKQSMRA